MSAEQKPHSMADEIGTLTAVVEFFVSEAKPQDRGGKAYDALRKIEGLVEQLQTAERQRDLLRREADDLKRINSEIVDVNTEACNRADGLLEQYQAALPIIEAVAAGKVGPAHGVLARDLLSNPASSPKEDA